MEYVLDFFKESYESFTIYVVEQRFVVGRGNEYFRSFKGKENLILSNESIKKRTSKILRWINKKVPNVSELVKGCFSPNPVIGIAEVVSALSKLFTVHEHQAAGPEVIDPIIIQEERIDKKYLTQLITLHKASILQPVIVILLKDNDFNRARKLLSQCPHGTNVKMIRNSGFTELYKVINNGVDNIDLFIDAFSRQSFSSCSRTPRKLLFNIEWAENSIVKEYTPLIFKVRSNLLFDEKDDASEDLKVIIGNLATEDRKTQNEKILIKSFECMTKINKIYCNDYGGKDIQDALLIAKELDNEILLAHVYRYSHFLEQYSERDKRELLLEARKIFSENNIEDHAIYCLNNNLLYDFYGEKINVRKFRQMQEEAVNNIPGLVGMSIIYNNTGVAHLYTGEPEEAIVYFTKGLDYSRDRIIQKLGLMSNKLIARDYCFDKIETSEIRKTLNYIFDNCGTTRLPFIAANFVTNIISIALKQHPGLTKDILREYPVIKLLKNALIPNQLGSGSLIQQINLLSSKFNEFNLGKIHMPSQFSKISGIRLNFLLKHGYNPTIFNAWL